MVIGRADERDTPNDAKGALRHRMTVEGSLVETIWTALVPQRGPHMHHGWDSLPIRRMQGCGATRAPDGELTSDPRELTKVAT